MKRFIRVAHRGQSTLLLDAVNRQEPTSSEPKTVQLEEKIAKLKTQMKDLQAIEIQLNESPDKQVSLTDQNARSMMMRGHPPPPDVC